jgi:hypothetical protein
MASGTILCSSAQPWALIRLGIKERQRGKMHGRVPHPLERGFYGRYGDAVLLGISGSQPEAPQVFQEATNCLHTHLTLAISEEKAGMPHAQDGTSFLGYGVQNSTDEKL